MVADGLTKALGPDRQRKLAKLMGMGVWQKSEDYVITGIDERKKEKGQEGRQGLEVAKV